MAKTHVPRRPTLTGDYQLHLPPDDEMNRKSRKKGRGSRARLGVAAILLVGLASVACYAAISATINGQPSTTPFGGFVVLLQPAGRFSQDQVKLEAIPLVPGGPGQRPTLSYQVNVCGSQPFSGVLLIGGDARLSHLQGIPALGAATAAAETSRQDLPDLAFLNEGTDVPFDLGPVQAIHITMTSPVKCASAYSTQQPAPQFFGQAQVITGQAAAPVERQWRLGWWAGPRSSQSWPSIGGLPGVSDNDLGEFLALDGLHGAWMRLTQQYFAVSVGGLQARASVDEARPSLSSSTSLDWEGTQPLQPTAVVTNTTSMSAWQNWLVGAGIFLGIGGSLMASLLYDWTRPNQSQANLSDDAARQARQERPANSTHRVAATTAAVILLAWFIGSRRRQT
jgi:hypothetical protein